MAITVQYAPSAALVAEAAQTAGQGDYNRWATQQQFQQQQLNQQRDLAQLQVANDQYMQKIGVLDQQFRQREQIAASQTEQLRNIANQQGLAQFDAANQNWRFGTGIQNDQYMQTQRLQTGLQEQQNSILDGQYRQNQQIAAQTQQQMRDIQAQNSRLQMSLQMDRVNTLSTLQARQQEQQAQFAQQRQMAILDGQQRAGLMGLSANLQSRQTAIEQANRIQAMNIGTKQQLDLSSALADQKFRQQYFLGEYSPALQTMSEQQYAQAQQQFIQKRDTMNAWLQQNGFQQGSPEYQQAQRRLMEEYMGIQSNAPLYTQAEQDFRAAKVVDGGATYIRNPNGSYDLLPDPNERYREVAMRGMNDVVKTHQALAMDQYNTVYRATYEAAIAGMPPTADPAKFDMESKRAAQEEAQKAYKVWMQDALKTYSATMGDTGWGTLMDGLGA